MRKRRQKAVSVKVRLSEDMAEAVRAAFEKSENAELSVYTADTENLDVISSSFADGEISFDLSISQSASFIIALTDAEMNGGTQDDVINFLNSGYDSDVIEYCYDAASVAWSYFRQVGGGNSMTWPFIVYVHPNGDIQGYTQGYVNVLNEIETRLGKSAVDEPYHVIFNANGGTGEMTGVSCYIGHPYCKCYAPACGFTRKGYKFKEWNTKADGTGKSYADQAELVDVTDKRGAYVTLYAIWSKVKYTITYNLDGGTNSADNPTKYYVNTATITLADPSKKGYTFGGWYSDKELTKKVTQIKKGSTGKKTFYAKWTANKYTVKFNGNGSTSGSMSAIKNIAYDSEKALTANAFKRTGYGRAEQYTAIYVHGGFNGNSGVSVAWPAPNTPVSYFETGSPWSLSMSRYVDPDNLEFSTKRKSDGKTWSFKGNDGKLIVSNQYYGDMGCIIVRPEYISDISTTAGSSYTVTAKFLDRNEKLVYNVNFFNAGSSS